MEEVFQHWVGPGPRRRSHRAAVQPHPRRGRGALRPGDDHPRRPRPSSPAPSPSCATSRAPPIDAELAGPPRRPGGALPACTTCGRTGQRVRFDVDTAGARRRAAPAHRGRRTQPGQPAADAGGAVPAALRSGPGHRLARHRRRRPPTVDPVTGTWHLVRLILRRDRVAAADLGALLAVLPVSYAATLRRAVPDRRRAGRSTPAGTARNPSIVALLGPVYGDSVGALAAQRGRAAAPDRRADRACSWWSGTPAPRRSRAGGSCSARPCSAGAPGWPPRCGVTYAADLLLGLLVAGGLVAVDLPAAGSLAYGLSVALAGVVFATRGRPRRPAHRERGRGTGARASARSGWPTWLRLAGDAGGTEWLSLALAAGLGAAHPPVLG